jgi:hypothetical protein
MTKVFIALVIFQGLAGNVSKLDATEPIPFFIHDGASVPGFVDSDRELAEFAVNAWARESGGKLKFVRSANEQSALVHVVWSGRNGGRFGETARILVGDKPGAVTFVMPDVRQLGEPLASAAARDPLLRDTIVYLTAVHELGHAVGLPHTNEFADIMYTFTNGGDFLDYFNRYRKQLRSRADIPKFSGLSEADRSALTALYR